MTELTLQENMFKDNPRDYKIAIVGCGGVGSSIAYILASMGFNLTLFDNGKVQETDPATGALNAKHIDDVYRVLSAKELISKALSLGVDVDANGRYDGQEREVLAVVCAEDDPHRHSEIWNANNLDTRYWIDIRNSGPVANIYFVDKKAARQTAYYEEEVLGQKVKNYEAMSAYMTKGLLPGIVGMFLRAVLNGVKVLPFAYEVNSDEGEWSITWGV